MEINVSNRFRIIGVATGFNILFEYSMRGINNLIAHPIFPLFLLGVYFPYFTIVEDMIRRFRLRDFHLILIGFIYGNLTSILLPGSLFTPPTYLGINWVNLLFVNVIWWGVIQGVLTFYIATRFTPRKWKGNLLSKKRWMVSALLIILIYVLFRVNARNLPRAEASGVIILLILSTVTAIILRKMIDRGDLENPVYRSSWIMDILSFSTILVFIISSIFLTYDTAWVSIHYVNLPALRAIVIWTLFIAVATIIYRVGSGREIPV